MSLNPTLDHLAVVQAVRAKWDQMTAGPARAWTITNEICLRLQALGEDAGLLEKTAGNHYLGYSTDVLLYRDGTAVDVLQDSDGTATPQWVVIAPIDPVRWRPPLGDVPETEPPPPESPAPPPDCSHCVLLQTGVDALIALRDGLEVIKSELASANEQRQVTISTLSRIYTRFEATPTREQLAQTVIPVKFKW